MENLPFLELTKGNVPVSNNAVSEPDAADRFHRVASSPAPQRGVVGWFGRPFYREARRVLELRALQRSALWDGSGLPAGEGRPVLLIPGFMAGRFTAEPLAHVLRAAGWDVTIAALGRNSGPAYHGIDIAGAELRALSERANQKVTLIGHSRGGQFARVLAVRAPHLVAQVITAGSPLSTKYPPFAVVKVPAELLDRAWRAGAFGEVDTDREQEVDDDRYAPFPESVDFVSIWSKTDGIVDWRTSADTAAFSIEVVTTHLGVIRSIDGVSAIGEALTRQE